MLAISDVGRSKRENNTELKRRAGPKLKGVRGKQSHLHLLTLLEAVKYLAEADTTYATL